MPFRSEIEKMTCRLCKQLMRLGYETPFGPDSEYKGACAWCKAEAGDDDAIERLSKIRILAFLQNQWFKDPESVRRTLEERPYQRNRLISAYLFMGCQTGKRLQRALGEEICDRILWEESSPQISGQANGRFPADIEHMAKRIARFRPNIVLAFGKIAQTGLAACCEELDVLTYHPNERNPTGWGSFETLTAPHPTSRNGNPMIELIALGRAVRDRINSE